MLTRNTRDQIKEVRAAWRRRWFELGLPWRPATGDRATVVAPHPDDETLACGGLLATKAQLGAQLQVIFLTSGEASLCSMGVDKGQVANVRRRQAVEALRILGVSPEQATWLGIEDGRIPGPGEAGFQDAVARLANCLSRVTSEIYCPHPADGLRDHEAAAAITVAAVRAGGLASPIVFYPVWAWFNARRPVSARLGREGAWRLDIRGCLERKERALRQYTGEVEPRCGLPYIGRLPRSILSNARDSFEVFISA